jgi:hypothetical protein
MGDKAKKIAMLVFALIFIVLMAVIMGTIVNKTNASNTKLVDTLDMTEGMELSNYASGTFKGNAVMNAINNGKSLGGKTKLFVFVVTKGEKGTCGTVYGYATGNSTTDYTEAQFGVLHYFVSGTSTTWSGLTCAEGDSEKSLKVSANYTSYSAPLSTDKRYINESAEFDSYLVYNVNDVPVGIYFVQK